MLREEFEKIVLDVLEGLPEEFSSKLENIDIVIEDDNLLPNPEGHKTHNLTLGTYHGVPLTKRLGRSRMPDKIILYKEAIERISKDETQLRKNIRKVLLHELGHYFGLDDKKLKKLGY